MPLGGQFADIEEAALPESPTALGLRGFERSLEVGQGGLKLLKLRLNF